MNRKKIKRKGPTWKNKGRNNQPIPKNMYQNRDARYRIAHGRDPFKYIGGVSRLAKRPWCFFRRIFVRIIDISVIMVTGFLQGLSNVINGLWGEKTKELLALLRILFKYYSGWDLLTVLPKALNEWRSHNSSIAEYLEKSTSLEIQGDFIEGLYRLGTARICNGSIVPFSVEGLECDLAECRVVEGLGEVINPDKCIELRVSVKPKNAGDVPLNVRLHARLDTYGGIFFEIPVVIAARPSTANTWQSKYKVQFYPTTLPVSGTESKDIVGLRLSDTLVPGYGCSIGEEYSVSLDTLVRDLHGFEGLWSCCLLGCGGWGCAYKCSRSNEQVVVKLPLEYRGWLEHGGVPPSISERVLRGYWRRVEAVWGLMRPGHSGILRLLAFSRIAPVMVYEYADQGSLRWQLDNGWEPSLRDVLVIGSVLGDALRYIHSRGLVHGDIKPGNVFVKENTPKLGDFSGIVRLLSASTEKSSRAHATPGWMAPEQVFWELKHRAKSKGLENRIDVYQLGNLLLYLLTGEVVDGSEADDLLEEALGLVEEDDVRSVLESMMRVDPVERISSEEASRLLRGLLARHS